MYFFNGYVYGSDTPAEITVKSIKPLDDMMMLITFNSGETRLFDASSLTGPVFRPLTNKAIFDNPVIEYGIITWDNGNIDCSSEYLYKNSFEYAEVI